MTKKLAKVEHHPLKRWRFEHGVTLTELAARMETSAGVLSDIENRKKEPSLSFAAALVKLTNRAVEFDDLVLR